MSARRKIALALLLPLLCGAAISVLVSSVWPLLLAASLTFGSLLGVQLQTKLALLQQSDPAAELEAKNKILELISGMQSEFIKKDLSSGFFDEMLDFLIKSTGSEYGFIGEILYQESGTPYLKTHAITDISWNQDTRDFYSQNISSGLEFYNLNTLFGVAITSGEAVIANDPANDSRAAGIPVGHPALNAFLGLPIYSASSRVGLIGLANRSQGYDQRLIEDLRPVVSTLGTVIEACRVHKNRAAFERELSEQRSRLESLYKVTTQAGSSFEEQIEKSLQIVCRELELELGIVSRISGDQYSVEHVYASDNKFAVGTQLKLESTFCSIALKSSEVVALHNIEQLNYQEHPCHRIFGLKSYIGCPLYLDGIPVGTVCFSSVNSRDKSFSESEKEFVRLAAHFIAANIERKIARDDLKATVEELELSNISLKQAHARVEQAAIAKSTFLASMSHELRTPLNSIIGFSQRLLKRVGKDLAERDLDALQTVERNAHKLMGLISDILDLAMLEAGGMQCQRSDIEVVSLLQDLVKQLKPQVIKKGIELRVVCKERHRLVFADKAMLEQIIRHLLSNAIRYTDKGFVEISLEVSNEQLSIRVRDSGIGISLENQERLFTLFTQIDQSEQRRRGGTGIGLVLIKTYVEMHNGRIEFSSQVGKGSEFCVYLPVDQHSNFKAKDTDDRLALEAQQPELKGRHILCIDDCPEVLKFLEKTFIDYQCQVSLAANSDQALICAEARPPDVICLDIELPDNKVDVFNSLSGMEVESHIPVVIISALTNLRESRWIEPAVALQKSADEYVLVQRVNSNLSRALDLILLIEDCDQSAKMIGETLAENKIEFQRARSCQQALAILASERFSAIILDLSLPDLESFSFLKQFKDTAQSLHTPIFIFSTREITQRYEGLSSRERGSEFISDRNTAEALLNTILGYMEKKSPQAGGVL